MEKEPDGLNLILHFHLLYVKNDVLAKDRETEKKGGVLREGTVQLW